MGRIGFKEIQRELDKHGADFGNRGSVYFSGEEVTLSPHEQAIENLFGEIDLEYEDWFNSAKCDLHGTLLGSAGASCSECRQLIASKKDQVHNLSLRYKLDVVLFTLSTFEDLVNMDDWLSVRMKEFLDKDREAFSDVPEDKLHPAYKTAKFSEVSAFKLLLKEKKLVFKLDVERRCSNTAFELSQIVDVWLGMQNEADLESMRQANSGYGPSCYEEGETRAVGYYDRLW